MSEPTFTSKPKQQQHFDDSLFDGGEQVPTAAHDDAAYSKAVELIKTRRNLDTIPQLVGNMTRHDKQQFSDQFDLLVRVASGDIVLRTAEVLEIPPLMSLQLALEAKPNVTVGKLRTFLGKFDGAAIAELEPIAGDLKKAVGKAPFLDVFPSGGIWLGDFARLPTLVRWYVETTAPALVAYSISQLADETAIVALAKTLDLDRALWDRWLQAAHGAPGVTSMWKTLAISKFSDINASLEAIAKPGAVRGVETVVGAPTTTTRQQLLESIGLVDKTNEAQFIAAVRHVNPSADDVLWLTDNLGLSAELASDLLVVAPGVTPAHIKTLLFTKHALPTKASTVQAIRKHAGSLTLPQILAQDSTITHATIVESPELRAWYLASASPRDLLQHDLERVPQSREQIADAAHRPPSTASRSNPIEVSRPAPTSQ